MQYLIIDKILEAVLVNIAINASAVADSEFVQTKIPFQSSSLYQTAVENRCDSVDGLTELMNILL